MEINFAENWIYLSKFELSYTNKKKNNFHHSILSVVIDLQEKKKMCWLSLWHSIKYTLYEIEFFDL